MGIVSRYMRMARSAPALGVAFVFFANGFIFSNWVVRIPTVKESLGINDAELGIALVFLALGYSTKAACLQTTGTGTAEQRVANWDNNRAYYQLCYSDTVPLYTAELLNLGKFPYKSSWVETDADGTPQITYDGQPAVRYMEYPVLTGLYQYLSMTVAKTYSALTRLVPAPIIAEVVSVSPSFGRDPLSRRCGPPVDGARRRFFAARSFCAALMQP